MSQLLYATGNPAKFIQAKHVCSKFAIDLQQRPLNVPELQSDSAEIIAVDKAKKGFEIFSQPLVVSDDSWSIPGLRGFPGPYMKYINDWFTPEDWLRLTKDLSDRRIILQQIVVFYDGSTQQVFKYDIEGVLLDHLAGTSIYSHSYVTSFDGGKHSNAERFEEKQSSTGHLRNVWHDFAEWYSKNHAQT